jgi:hypothetical protein
VVIVLALVQVSWDQDSLGAPLLSGGGVSEGRSGLSRPGGARIQTIDLEVEFRHVTGGSKYRLVNCGDDGAGGVRRSPGGALSKLAEIRVAS